MDETADAPVNFQQLVIQASSEDPEVRYQAVTAVKMLLSSQSNQDWRTQIDSLIKCGILPILVNCLQTTNNPSLQFEAAWALTNIAAGTSLQTQAVVDAGAVPLLIELLTSPHQNVCEQAVWTLGNIIGGGSQLRDYAISLGVVTPLLNLINSNTPISLLKNATRVIMNLCRDKDPLPPTEILRDIFPTLKVLIHHADASVLEDILCAISYVTDAGNDMIQMVVESGVVPILVSHLPHGDDNMKVAAIRAVGNIITGTDEQTQAVLNCDALKHFPSLLSHPDIKICKEALWILSNLAVGNHAQIQAVIDADLIPLIIHHLDKGELKVQKEAAWAVRNLIFCGTKNQVASLLSVDVIPPLCNLLNCKDIQTIKVVLDSFIRLMKRASKEERLAVNYDIVECGGLHTILLLRDNPHRDREHWEVRFVARALASMVHLKVLRTADYHNT